MKAEKVKRSILKYVNEDEIPVGYIDQLIQRVADGELTPCTDCEAELVEAGGECSVCRQAEETLKELGGMK